MRGLTLLQDAASPTHLSESQSKELISLYGVTTPRRRFATDQRTALAAFNELSVPVAVKLVSETLHKTEIGGVRLNISDGPGLQRALADIARSAAAANVGVKGFLIEEMATPGVEVLVGGVIDPTFGPAIVLGLGGIFAEIFDDIAARICPVATDDAMDMIGEIRAAPLLMGARGRPALDIESLARIVVAIGGADGLLMEHAARIREIDINPVIVSTAGAVAVDARVILHEQRA